MLEIEFWDREKEMEEITKMLNTRPDLITFIYGPINSGKTELIQHLIKQLSDDFVVFYINLRERMVKDYNDFIEALFEIRISNKRKIVVKELIAEATKFAGIPISKDLLNLFFKEDKPKNAFRYIVDTIKEIRERGKMPVLIVDELQKIGDVKVDDYLIYELFNLFIRLTKELHACHVFTITSDSLFLERVYAEAILHGRCDYVLVDDFSEDIAKRFLERYGFNREEVELVWEYFGGKPVYLIKAIKAKLSGEDLKELCEKFLNFRFGQICEAIFPLRDKDEKFFRSVVEFLSKFKDRDTVKFEYTTDILRFLVRENILFLDPVRRIVKPQSRLDLLAIRRILNDNV